jgi:TRAP-type mannitol/chloroaromatic compound transport system permease small subunit
MWPIKVIMCLGILLMLLQALAEFFRDIAPLRGVEIETVAEGRPAVAEDRPAAGEGRPAAGEGRP